MKEHADKILSELGYYLYLSPVLIVLVDENESGRHNEKLITVVPYRPLWFGLSHHGNKRLERLLPCYNQPGYTGATNYRAH